MGLEDKEKWASAFDLVDEALQALKGLDATGVSTPAGVPYIPDLIVSVERVRRYVLSKKRASAHDPNFGRGR